MKKFLFTLILAIGTLFTISAQGAPNVEEGLFEAGECNEYIESTYEFDCGGYSFFCIKVTEVRYKECSNGYRVNLATTVYYVNEDTEKIKRNIDKSINKFNEFDVDKFYATASTSDDRKVAQAIIDRYNEYGAIEVEFCTTQVTMGSCTLTRTISWNIFTDEVTNTWSNDCGGSGTTSMGSGAQTAQAACTFISPS